MAEVTLHGVLVNGGSGINLMHEHTMQDLSLQITRPANFSITMTDQHYVSPVGLMEPLPSTFRDVHLPWIL